jgi:DNA-binding transcriptional LysR family regulator
MATVRQLRDFVALAEAGSFTRAAATLHVAQPALTYQIKRLEAELALQLFVRGPRGVTTTPEAEALLPMARAALHAVDALGARAAELRGGGRVLRVGFMGQGPGDLMPEILRAFRTKHPEVEVSLVQSGFEDCFVGVRTGATDVGFMTGPLDEDDSVAFAPLFEEEVVAAMAGDHPLAGRARLRIEEVVEHPLVADLHPRGRWTDWWDAVAHRGGRPVRYAGRVMHHDEWLEAVRLGGCIGLCPQSTARYYPRPGLTFVPVDGMGTAEHGVLWRSAGADAIVADFVAIARQAAASRPSPGPPRDRVTGRVPVTRPAG